MHVLVSYDGSYPAQRAVKYAADTYPDEDLTLLRVIETASGSTSAGIKLAQEELKGAWNEDVIADSISVADLIDDDIEFKTDQVSGDPADEIVRYVEANNVDHIVIGSHGRNGIARALLGNVAEEVARQASVPVTIVT